MNRFRKPLLFLSDSALFLCAVGFYLIAVRYMPYTIVGGGNLTMDLPLLYGCIALSQLLFKTYDSLWRYAESKEYLTLIAAALVGFGLYEFLARMLRWSTMSFVLLSAIAAVWVLEMLSVRFLYRVNRSRGFRRKEDGAVPVVIIGAGGAGERLLDELRSNPNSRYAVQSFFDDDPGKRGKQLHGVPIRGPISAALPRIKAMGVHEVIVAIPSLSEVQRKNILEQVSDKSVHISILPDTLDLISGKPIRTQLREVRIEDLLGRDVVDLDNAAINTLIAGKTVLVTGGGGSIGSELCRQIAKRDPKQLVIVDIYENNAYDIQQELKFRYGSRLDLRVEITQTNWAARLVAALQGFDTPTNVCPSIHVSSTVAVELAVRRSESLGKKGWLKAANFVVTVAICLSTMFLKQHSAVDVVLGIALSLLLGWVTWHTNWQAALKKTPLRVLFQQRL